MLKRHEWSRSRYWLCHFLHSRHERAAIDWSARADDALLAGNDAGDAGMAGDAGDAAPVLRWLSRIAGAQASTMPWVVTQATSRCAEDPAYIQSLRLLVKEQRYHGQLLAHTLARAGVAGPSAGPTQDLFIKAGRTLGVRYTLSAMLLSDIFDVAMLEQLGRCTGDATVRAVCHAIVREKRQHIAFHTERLTMEFAQFNFVRRNLRRLRLRAMFSAKLARLLVQDRKCIAAMDCVPGVFARNCWRRIVGILKVMVPYRRDELLATLVAQDQQPYAQADDRV